jgi:hypothetical protein
MRLAVGICTLGLLLAIAGLLTMRGTFTRPSEMEICYQYDASQYDDCLQRNEQRSAENIDGTNTNFLRGLWMCRGSVGLLLAGGMVFVLNRLFRSSQP